MIPKTDPAYLAAIKAIDAMHDYWKLNPCRGAVQWLEDSDGRVLIFTRGEYRDRIMQVCGGPSNVEMFQLEGDSEESQ